MHEATSNKVDVLTENELICCTYYIIFDLLHASIVGVDAECFTTSHRELLIGDVFDHKFEISFS